MRSLAASVAFTLFCGCSTLHGNVRVLGGAVAGAGVGAAGGAILSPNDESRGLNALVFGLSGALVGGALGLLTDRDENASERQATDLRARELGTAGASREYLVLPEQKLPDFVRRRIQPPIIEEFTEKDQVGEDGSLHEPHHVYRIKRPAELFADPAQAVDGGRVSSPANLSSPLKDQSAPAPNHSGGGS